MATFLSCGATISLMLRRLTASKLLFPKPWKDSLMRMVAESVAATAMIQPMMLMRQASRKASFLPFHCMIDGIKMLGMPAKPWMEPARKVFWTASIVCKSFTIH